MGLGIFRRKHKLDKQKQQDQAVSNEIKKAAPKTRKKKGDK